MRDYRDAISYACTLPEVDADRIGIWGSSYSGGHVLVVGAIDRRVKCVACQVPLISGHRNARRLVRSDFIAAVGGMFDEDRANRYAGEPPAMIPVVDEDPMAPSSLPTADSYAWFTETAAARAPSWRNEVTLRSVEMFWEYEPGAYIQWVSPTPLLMVVAAGDHLTVSDLAIEAYERAREPKKLVILPERALRRLRDGVRRRLRRGGGLVHRAPPGRMSMATKDVLHHHLAAFGAGDVDEMLKDYTDDSVLITADGTITGLGPLREAFTAFFAGLFAPGTYEFTLEAERVEGEVAFITWHATCASSDDPAGRRHLPRARRQDRRPDLCREDGPEIGALRRRR